MFTRFSRMALFLLLAGLFSMPFLLPFHTAPIPSFYSEWSAAALLLLACLFVPSARSSGCSSIRIPVVTLLFFVLISIFALQLNLNSVTYVYNAVVPILFLIGAIAAASLGSACMRVIGLERLMLVICAAAVAGGVASVGLQFVQMYGYEQRFFSFVAIHKDGGSFFSANLGQVNHLTTYLSWALIGGMYLYARRHISYKTVALLTVVFMIGLVLAGSRMSWLIVTWIAAASALLTRGFPKTERPQCWQCLIALPLLYLIVTLVLPQLVEIAGFELNKTSLGRIQDERIDTGRRVIYAQAWDVFLQHPILGVGPGEFAFSQFLLLDRFEKSLLATSAHNLVLDLLVTTGLLGAISVFFTLGLWYRRVRRQKKTLEYVAIILMLSTLGIHAMLEYPLWYGYFLWPAAFFLGCLETKFIIVERSRMLEAVPYTGALAALWLIAFMFLQYREVESLNVRFNGDRAVSTNEIYGAAPTSLISVYNSSFFTPYAEALLCLRLDLDGSDLPTSLAVSGRAMRFMPATSIVFRHAAWLGMAGREDEALTYLIRLSKAHPTNLKEVEHDLSLLSKENPAMFSSLMARFKESIAERKVKQSLGMYAAPRS